MNFNIDWIKTKENLKLAIKEYIYSCLSVDEDSFLKIDGDYYIPLLKNTESNYMQSDEVKKNKKKIEFYKNKHSKLLELYLNEMIDKETYKNKKEELDNNIAKINKVNNELILKKGIPKDILKDKIKNLKQCILNNLNCNENNISDDIIDNFVERVIVYKDKFVWKLNYLNDIIDMKINGRQKSSKLDLYVNNNFLCSKQGCCTS